MLASPQRKQRFRDAAARRNENPDYHAKLRANAKHPTRKTILAGAAARRGRPAWNSGLSQPEIAGAKNPNWQGGIATNVYVRRIARAIRRRDKHTCCDCGQVQVSPALHVHHEDRNRLNNVDANLVTLCSPCHKSRHRA